MAKPNSKYSGATVIPMMAMTMLRALPPEKLVEHAKSAAVNAEKASRATADNRATFPALGKVIAALKYHFNQESGKGASLFSTMTFPEFFHMKTGSKPNNHAESCAKAYGAYVDNGLIAEQDYDYNTSDALEKAAAIVTKVEGDFTSNHIIAAAEILKTRPKDAIKRLLAIIETIDGPKTIEADKAAEYLKLIFGSGHIELVMAMTTGEIARVTDTAKLDRLAGFIPGMVKFVSPDAKPHSPPARTAAPMIVTKEIMTNEMWVTNAFPSVKDQETITAIIADLSAYKDAHGAEFPADLNAFNKWIDEVAAVAPAT